MSRPPGFDWTPEAIGRLRQLWSEGHSFSEIGERLGVSKNAVAGKANRLGLSARPSPIRRGGPPRAPRIERAPRVTLAPIVLPVVKTPPVVAPIPQLSRARAPEPAPAAPAVIGRVVACCWPIGEPGVRGFRFCDAGSSPGKPYCQEHSAVAYVRVRDRRDDVAAAVANG